MIRCHCKFWAGGTYCFLQDLGLVMGPPAMWLVMQSLFLISRVRLEPYRACTISQLVSLVPWLSAFAPCCAGRMVQVAWYFVAALRQPLSAWRWRRWISVAIHLHLCYRASLMIAFSSAVIEKVPTGSSPIGSPRTPCRPKAIGHHWVVGRGAQSRAS